MSRICHHCVGDRCLSREIRTTGEREECGWCSRNAPTFTAERLAERVGPVYETVVGWADEGFIQIDGHPSWGPEGRPPAELMTDLLEADDEGIGTEVIRVLAERNARRRRDDGPDYYDETSTTFDFVDAAGTGIRADWNAYCEGLQHASRFFTDPNALNRIFNPLLNGTQGRRAIRTVRPGDALGTLYRGRRANDEQTRRTIYSRPIGELAAPPRGRSEGGRMNAAGIGVFYAASDIGTCVAELRVPVGGAAVVGRFEVIRPLRLLDLHRLEKATQALSPFDEDYAERLGWQQFITGFHEEIRRAVIPGRETLDYLPTQSIAEYLWTRPEPLDGLIYGSAQISGRRRNVVLFPHACSVEGADAELKRKVRHVRADGPDEHHPDRQARVEVSVEPLPAGRPDAAAEAARNDEDDWFIRPADDGRRVPAAPGPALRLTPDGLSVVTVEAIRMQATAVPVTFKDWEAFPRL